jgi:hypothetical protein
MTPIKFKGSNTIFGDNQNEYQALPALVIEDKEGTVITAWQLTEEELHEVVKNKVIYLQQLTFSQRLQPVYLTASLADLALFHEVCPTCKLAMPKGTICPTNNLECPNRKA